MSLTWGMACGPFLSDWMLYLYIVVSTRCLPCDPEAHTFTRNCCTCKGPFCSLLSLDSLCCPNSEMWIRLCTCPPGSALEWPFPLQCEDAAPVEGVHFPACSLCPQSVGLPGRAHLHFSPCYENGGPHHPPDTPCITSFSPSRVCSFSHQMTLHVICLLSSSLLFTEF